MNEQNMPYCIFSKLYQQTFSVTSVFFCKAPYLGITKYNCSEARKLFLQQFLTEF